MPGCVFHLSTTISMSTQSTVVRLAALNRSVHRELWGERTVLVCTCQQQPCLSEVLWHALSCRQLLPMTQRLCSYSTFYGKSKPEPYYLFSSIFYICLDTTFEAIFCPICTQLNQQHRPFFWTIFAPLAHLSCAIAAWNSLVLEYNWEARQKLLSFPG